MIAITNFRQGAVLNHNHGEEHANALRVRIEGISDTGTPVTVNGVPAEMDGTRFEAGIDLTQKLNPVTAKTVTRYGTFSTELVLVWDKKSFRRCNFYIDDHSFLFRELALERPHRAFDHFYLKGLKAIHDKYGFKVTLNCFYHDDHHDFALKDMPELWKGEFQDNADWLKFSFHAYGEFPDRPYLETTAEEFGRDWDLVQNEIVRFAGEACYIPPVVIHWANIHPAAAREAIRRGVRCYSVAFRPRVMGGPSLADRRKGGDMTQVETRSAAGSDRQCGSEGLAMHYGFEDEANYLKKHGAFFDPALGVFFFGPCGKNGSVCCNLVPLAEVPERVRDMLRTGAATGTEVFGAASHEQYSFPDYPNYLPDHLDRIERAVRGMVEEGGCKPVFFAEGLLGNTAWDD